MEIITGKELSDRLQPLIPDLHKHCGIIFSVNQSDMASNRSTVTFANINGVEGMITAEHVYSKLRNLDTRIFCCLKEQKIRLPEAQIYSKELDYVWFPVNCLGDLELDSVSFFDTTHALDISRKIYDDYCSVAPDLAAERPSNFLIHGSPNYAGSGDNSSMSLQAMHVSLRQFHYHQSISGKNPQISFQFDSGQLAVNDDDLKRRYKQNFQSDNEDSAFGGYSGGPLCVFGYDGFFLIGITVECKSFDALYVGIASPISSIIDEISSQIRP